MKTYSKNNTVCVRKKVLKNLCQSLFLNKVASLRPATLLKRDSGKDIFL